MLCITCNSLDNYLTHFDTETVSVTSKLRSEAYHKRSITVFNKKKYADNGLKKRLQRPLCKAELKDVCCLQLVFGPVLPFPADDLLTQFVLIGELHVTYDTRFP